jgi:hypothetical protein
MRLVESLLNYSSLYNYIIPSTALRLKRLLCCCSNSKSACQKCQMRRPRTPSLKQINGNLSPLTLKLWLCALCGCKALVAKPFSTPENRLGLGAGLILTLTSMTNLASTYRNQGRWKEAEEMEVQVMETSDQHRQPGVDVLGPRAVERGRRARGASDGDELEGAWGGASRHAD